MRFESNSVEDTKRIAAALAQCVQSGDVIMLTGDLGAGKTHFAQGFGEALGIDEPIVSPTFNIVLTYPQGRVPLYHFDLYRLDTEDQLDDIAFYDFIEGDGVSLVEWGERFPDAFPDDCLHVFIIALEEGKRIVSVESTGPRSADVAQCWVKALSVRE